MTTSMPPRTSGHPDRRPSSRRTRPEAVLAGVLAGGLLLSGCGQAPAVDHAEAPATAGAPASETAVPVATATAAPAMAAPGTVVTVSDAWAKASEEGMTGAFGVLANTSGQDVTLVGASSDRAGSVEIHETVDDGTGATIMREVEGGLDIPAGGSAELVPGGNHLMLMDLQGPIAPGDPVEIELEFADGRTQSLTATAKEFAGAQESYGGSGEMTGGASGGADHGGH